MKSVLTRLAANALSVLSLLLLAATLWITACNDPSADHPLSEKDMKADLAWLFSIYRNNYAPLEYKEKMYGFTLDALERKYTAEVGRLIRKNGPSMDTNASFYQMLFRLNSTLRDAHTAGQISPAGVPGNAKVAYLGFSGQRLGDGVRVTSLMPTIDPTTFPVKVGDVITEVDGMPVMKYIDKYLTPYRDLGDQLSNRTMHSMNLATRLNLNMPLPPKPNVLLKVTRNSVYPPQTVKVELPWIQRDLYDYNLQQQAAAPAQAQAQAMIVTDPATRQRMRLAVLDHRGKEIPADRLPGKKPPLQLYQTYKFESPSAIAFLPVQAGPAIPGLPGGAPALQGMDKLRLERFVPANAIPIPTAQTYPAYIYSVDVTDKNGKVVGKKRVGYIRIDTFEPGGSVSLPGQDDAVVSEVKATLDAFKANGVTSVVVDTIDNPGGSVALAARIAQLFSTKKLVMPGVRFGLNDSWLMQIQQLSLTGSDNVRELNARLYNSLRSEKNAGQRISSVHSMEEMLPYGTLDPSTGQKFGRVVILQSEMNASCGDLFPAIMKDNGLAVTAGTKTMGAGGNVNEHSNDQAPNSHFRVAQTESLTIRRNGPDGTLGSYIENVGVEADVPLDVNAGTVDQYASTLTTVNKIIVAKDPLTALAPLGQCVAHGLNAALQAAPGGVR